MIIIKHTISVIPTPKAIKAPSPKYSYQKHP